MSKGSNSSAWASHHSSVNGMPSYDPSPYQSGVTRTWQEALEQYPALLELYPLAAPVDETAESIPSETPRQYVDPRMQFIREHDGDSCEPKADVQEESFARTASAGNHEIHGTQDSAVASSRPGQPSSARIVVQEWERLEKIKAELASREESILRREEQVKMNELRQQRQKREILEMRQQLEKYSEEIERQVLVLTQKQQDLTEARLQTAELQRQLRARLATAVREDVVAAHRNGFHFDPARLGPARQ